MMQDNKLRPYGVTRFEYFPRLNRLLRNRNVRALGIFLAVVLILCGIRYVPLFWM